MGLAKGRHEDAIQDLNELLTVMVHDMQNTPSTCEMPARTVVIAFFKLHPDMMHLHREISVEGDARLGWPARVPGGRLRRGGRVLVGPPLPWVGRARAGRWEACDSGKSLCIFSADNSFRKLCGRIATNE